MGLAKAGPFFWAKYQDQITVVAESLLSSPQFIPKLHNVSLSRYDF